MELNPRSLYYATLFRMFYSRIFSGLSNVQATLSKYLSRSREIFVEISSKGSQTK